ncbi:MAG: hypothetical protein H8E44_26455 [Planctomycetes bacterium]|nr:hypothetical protein [Planctomycetota bacterium]MBL7043874.1 hypothetical protein [Pirellulaceae bacterium]
MDGWPSQREPVEWLVTDFATRIRQGEHPTIAEYATKYPEYATQIEELFPAVAKMEQLRIQETVSREAAIR